MKSKIEKIEPRGATWYADDKALLLELNRIGVELENKVNELVEAHNRYFAPEDSQSQPEEKKMTKEDIEYSEKQREKEIQEGIAWLKQQEKEKMIPVKNEDINVGKLKELASDNYGKDTPEEWEKEFKFLYGHLYIQNEDGEFCKINGETEDMIDFIKQLLEDREREMLEEQWNVVMQKGYWEGREDEEFIQGLSKLNNK